jgi:hypothetical protein
MDTQAELIIPIEHGAPGGCVSHGAQSGRGADVSVDRYSYVDMPLHLIPPSVPVDLPSRKVSVYIGGVCVCVCVCSRVCVHVQAGRISH